MRVKSSPPALLARGGLGHNIEREWLGGEWGQRVLVLQRQAGAANTSAVGTEVLTR